MNSNVVGGGENLEKPYKGDKILSFKIGGKIQIQSK